MIVLINYANAIFKDSQKLNSITGKEVGLFDRIVSYSPKDLDETFFNNNRNIFKQKKGNGYWLWKPYIIKKSLESINDGDYLFYCDSGAYFIDSIRPIIDISKDCNLDIIVFELGDLEKMWTKRDAFILMNCDRSKYADSKQRLASFSLWKKSAFSIEFINEFLYYAQDERILTDMDNQCGSANYPGFKEHRHDQSIFSLLSKTYEIEAFRDPSQWGNDQKQDYPNSSYGQLIELTRKKNDSLLKKLISRILLR